MKLSSWLAKDRDGKLVVVPAKPGSTQDIHNRLMLILEEVGEITGYDDFEPVDKYLMLAYWTRHQRLRDILGERYDDFCDWFRNEALYPDYIRQGRQILVRHGLVEVPARVKQRMKAKAQAIQQSFSTS